MNEKHRSTNQIIPFDACEERMHPYIVCSASPPSESLRRIVAQQLYKNKNKKFIGKWVKSTENKMFVWLEYKEREVYTTVRTEHTNNLVISFLYTIVMFYAL